VPRARRINLTDVVYGILETRPREGFTPREIRRRAEARAFRDRANFPYLQLWRLADRGEIVERDGRYYAPEAKG
jgi:hypothetical protein